MLSRRRWIPVFSLMVALGLGMAHEAVACGMGGGLGEAATASIISSAATTESKPSNWIREGAKALYVWAGETAKAGLGKFRTAYQVVKLAMEGGKTTIQITKQQRQVVEFWAPELQTTTLTEVIEQIEATNYSIGFTRTVLKALLLEEVEKQKIDVPPQNITE